MRARNAHTAAFEGIAPGAEGEVDPRNPTVALHLRAGSLAPVDAEGESVVGQLRAATTGQLVALWDRLAAAREEAMPTREQLDQAMRDVDAMLSDLRSRLAASQSENCDLRVALGEMGGKVERAECDLNDARAKNAALEADMAALTAPDSGGPAPTTPNPGDPADPFIEGGEGPISAPTPKPARARRSG